MLTWDDQKWTQTFGYDLFGNITKTVPNGDGGVAFAAQYDSYNHVSNLGVTYDAMGNTTTDNLGNAYTYDAENRLVTAGVTTYVYDAEGRRVAKKTSGTITSEYLLDASGGQLIELDGSGNVLHTSIFANGQLIATYKNDNQTYFHFNDWLGNRRFQTNAAGDAPHTLTCTNYPFGDGLNCTGTGVDATEHHFTGKERDAESGLDNFEARYYSSSMGRFMRPDPMGGHVEDPQTLNRYAYARNNPVSITDPTGLDFYLSCTPGTDANGKQVGSSTCQQMQVGTDKNGNAQMAWVQGQTGDNGFTATQIGNDANGNLVDRTTGTGTYTADVTGGGVQLSNGGTSATGVFLNKDVDLTGTNQVQSYDTVVRAGNLPGFLFTFQNSKLEAGQTAAGFFTAGGTALDVDRALQRAGFNYTMFFGLHFGSNEYRSPGAPSGHFVVDPTIREPILGVPQTRGTMHFGETNPKSDILKHAGEVF